MRVARKMLCAFVAATVLCLMLATAAFAAEGGSLWLNIDTDAQQNQTAVVICADVTVTNGMVELRYDSNELTYSSLTVNDAYVGTFAVNTDTEGVVKIAWVAPGAYEADTTGMALITVNFVGAVSQSVVAVQGNVYDAQGDLVEIISDLDTNALRNAIAKAEKLYAADYTAETFATVQTALAEAKAVMADKDATQAQVDAAAANLINAMDALQKVPGADTGDTVRPFAVLMALSALGMAVCLTKKGRWAK